MEKQYEAMVSIGTTSEKFWDFCLSSTKICLFFSTLEGIHEQDPPSEILAKFWNFKLVPKVIIRYFAIENFFARSGKKLFIAFLTQKVLPILWRSFFIAFLTQEVLVDTTNVPPTTPPLCIYVGGAGKYVLPPSQSQLCALKFCIYTINQWVGPSHLNSTNCVINYGKFG